jgi:hypothetical protein
MIRYKVEIIADYTVTVEAETEEDAEEKALDAFQLDGPDHYDVESIKEVRNAKTQ